MTERVIDPARLGFVDVVTASHAHTDHLDPDTLRALPDAELVAPEAHRELAAERAGRAPTGIDDGETVEVAGFDDHRRPRRPRGRSSATPRAACSTSATSSAAARSPSTTRATRSPTTAWRSASAARDRRRAAADQRPRARAPRGRQPDGEEAAALAHEIGARLAVPMHFEMFEFNTEPPDAFVAACERLGQPYRVLRAGERLTLRSSSGKVMQTSVPPAGRGGDREGSVEVGDQRQAEPGARAVHARGHSAALVAHGDPQLVAVPLDAHREGAGRRCRGSCARPRC